MLSLIGREIRDHVVYVLASCVISAVMIVLAIRSFWGGVDAAILLPLGILMSMSFLVFCVLGAAQMYGDRANRLSALLGTLAVTRNRILAARILVGALAVMMTVMPLVITAMILLRLFVPGAELWYPLFAEVSVTITLSGFACYCVGLLIGWTTSRVWLLAGNLASLTAIMSLIHIKGFGPGTMAILVLFIGALLLRIRHNFASAAL